MTTLKHDEAQILGHDDILKIADIKIEKVYIDEWKANVYLKGLSGNARDEWEEFILKSRSGNGSMRGIRAKLASLSLCDENGNLLFKQKELEALGEKSAAALQRIFEKSQDLSRIGNQDWYH